MASFKKRVYTRLSAFGHLTSACIGFDFSGEKYSSGNGRTKIKCI